MTASQEVECRPVKDLVEFVELFSEIWANPGGPDSLAARFSAVSHPDVRCFQPQIPPTVGRDDFRERFVRPLFILYPDLRGRVERWAVNDDTAYIESVFKATAGRRRLTFRVCDRMSLRDGLIVERETYMDPLPALSAVMARPSAWPRWVRARLHEYRHRRRAAAEVPRAGSAGVPDLSAASG